MSKKLEKLREVNTQLSNILMELETRIFVDNISDVKERIIREDKPKAVVAEIK
jgi:hypothetical protein